MPFTPFHFGPGAALHALAPRQLSFMAFAGANVLVDVEPLYYMLIGQEPLHRFFHTYIGVTLVMLATVAVFLLARRLARTVWLPNPGDWQALRLRPVMLGAAAGSYSHIVLDSVMHADIHPLAPFSQANALYLIVSLDALHNFCLLSGVLALVWLAARELQRDGGPKS
jgi:hypothetical protein